ncbi:hypothetical protein JT317_gp21 [Klebsiella phage YMC16/01/N133_KPN_BP]|uniref:Uncharacterized protein n=1 Tax=Klebsiella phage YMC16/01/N133_KPN_BP TaxID=2026102 RepID=A0A248XD53_9CAUD|nr:hypothetical protein JT317_gp21 [Klebsiella phage YMC16/01/N133_KPN_BP]ASW27640.1 hypothetical protein KPNN133_021 [Klebsiella phage YMC16/01/N133_KPN_BP]
MTFRDQKRKARRQLHQRLAEPVLYLTDPDATPVDITVRLHLRFDALGELLTVSAGFADRQELTPRIIFMNDQISPKRNAIVVTKDMGAFNIETDVAPDDITTTAMVTPVSKSMVQSWGWDPDALWLGLTPPAIVG